MLKMKNKAQGPLLRRGTAVLVTAAMLLPAVGCFAPPPNTPSVTDQTPPAASGDAVIRTRSQLLHFSDPLDQPDPQPKVPAYHVEPDLSNVENAEQIYLTEKTRKLLADNMFAVVRRGMNEFFEGYENNRYATIPNFVTVDSLMHTYHLYFSMLLNRTEKEYLSGQLLALSRSMLETAQNQYQALKGTEWEEAALRSTAFFAIGAALQDDAAEVPSYVSELVKTELARIRQAAGIDTSLLTQDYLDYTQFRPRGYYQGDPVLEAYFRAMMWYGQVNFTQKDETLNRAALLITLAMEEGSLPDWEKIYTVTACFAGVSDDLTFYEYSPAIHAAYGNHVSAADLAENAQAWQAFTKAQASMKLPVVNSIPVEDGTENIPEAKKGFRFMGQRFTVDAAVMQRLIYSNVKENPAGELRMLPDALDVPAALGSDSALNLLNQQGDTAFAGYAENMAQLQEMFCCAQPDSWGTSLYSGWLYTLQPLLQEKQPGSPSFMLSDAWKRKNLETFCGSYTELKHDTVLYGKQVMAEMGGGPEEVHDDRGYVEPEPQVYRRFAALTHHTREGLDQYGILSPQDKEILTHLEELADQLLEISYKELQNEPLTESQYELIRTYGGTLEHLWLAAVEDRVDTEYASPREIPASLVTDIATDPNGSVLQIANGQPAEILVVVPVDGKLRIASGFVYNFYQFTSPIDQRMTDAEWRYRSGEWCKLNDDGTVSYWQGEQPAKPWWTEPYWNTTWE